MLSMSSSSAGIRSVSAIGADASEVTQVEWVPLGSVPELITAGKIWNAGSLVALMRLLMNDS
jgi:hypothetical protein